MKTRARKLPAYSPDMYTPTMKATSVIAPIKIPLKIKNGMDPLNILSCRCRGFSFITPGSSGSHRVIALEMYLSQDLSTKYESDATVAAILVK